MVILVIFILFLSAVVIIGDERLGLWAKLSLTFIGLGLQIPASYLVKSTAYSANALLLPSLPVPRSYLPVVLILSTVVISFLLKGYLAKLKMRN